MYVCMYVSIYICVRDKLEQSVHAVKNVRLYWHQNPGSLLVSRKCRRPIEWFWNGARRHKQDKRGQKLDWH